MSIGREFLEKTHYKNLPPSHQSQKIEQPPLEKEYDTTKDLIKLPEPSADPFDLSVAIERRRSIRTYSPTFLSLSELSYLLYVTQGVKEVSHVTLRTVPSAGARHAFETYLLVNRVEGLRAGLYRFLAMKHQLQEMSCDPDMAVHMTMACLGQAMVKTSAVTFIWTAIPYRMKWRYSERGYRYLYLDAGHVCQNLYLGAEAVDAGVCAIAAFDDEEMNTLLALDGEEEFVIYLATVGKRKN